MRIYDGFPAKPQPVRHLVVPVVVEACGCEMFIVVCLLLLRA